VDGFGVEVTFDGVELLDDLNGFHHSEFEEELLV